MAESVPRPGDRPRPLPELSEELLERWWRLHWEDDPCAERRYPGGRHRFDAPGGEFGVTYASDDPHAAFAETYGDARVVGKGEAARRRSRLWSTRPLRLLRLDDMTVAAAFGLDNRISTERPYDRTQAWSLAWHTWYPELDGVAFLGRKSAPHRSLCLYLDRCSRDLRSELEGTLLELRADGLRACFRYRITPALYF